MQFNVNCLPWTGQNREKHCTSGFWLEKLVQLNVNYLPWTGQNREEQCTSGFWLEELVQFDVNCLPWTGQNRGRKNSVHQASGWRNWCSLM